MVLLYSTRKYLTKFKVLYLKHTGEKMKTKSKFRWEILFTLFALIFYAHFTAFAATYVEDFDDGKADNATLNGNAVIESGSLRLTQDTNSQIGTMIISNLAGESQRHESFTAMFDLQIGPSTAEMGHADGLSFCLANVPTNTLFGENGSGSGLTVSFDTWDNGEYEAPAISVLINDTLFGDILIDPYTDGNFVPVTISLDNTGLLNIQFDSVDLTNFATGYITGPSEHFCFGARTGGAFEEHRIDNISITTVEVPGYYDLIHPDDTIKASSTNYPADCGADKAIDDNYNTKYRNFDKENSGFTVSPSANLTMITGIVFTTASNAPECDPASVTILGSLDGSNFVNIVTDLSLSLPDTRLAQVAFAFTNDQSFSSYKIFFPSLKDSGSADSMQICEVGLMGIIYSKDITTPNDAIMGSSDNFPFSENPSKAIDNNKSTKYLNFDKDNSGFTVTPSIGQTIIYGISLTTANDSPERDPASVTIRGSQDGLTFIDIVVGLSTPLPDERKKTVLFDFSNDNYYDMYEVTFPTLKNSSLANSMQIAEVELIGEVVPEPAVFGLFLSVIFIVKVVLQRKF